MNSTAECFTAAGVYNRHGIIQLCTLKLSVAPCVEFKLENVSNVFRVLRFLISYDSMIVLRHVLRRIRRRSIDSLNRLNVKPQRQQHGRTSRSTSTCPPRARHTTREDHIDASTTSYSKNIENY